MEVGTARLLVNPLYLDDFLILKMNIRNYSILITPILLLFIFLFHGCFPDDPEKAMIQKFIDSKQQEIGQSCQELHDEAIEYINVKISPLIKKGRSGKDWVTLFYKPLQKEVEDYSKKVSTCLVCQKNGQRAGIKIDGYFEELSGLFSPLDQCLKMYGNDPPTAKSFPHSVFIRIEDYYNFCKCSGGKLVIT
jgi:hypothetical protein